MFCELKGFVRWVEVRLIRRDLESGLANRFQMVPTLVYQHHRFDQCGHLGLFGEVRRDAIQLLGRRNGEAVHGGKEAPIVRWRCLPASSI